MDINKLWVSGTESDWSAMLDSYWNYVKPDNMQLEKDMDVLNPDYVKKLDAQGWYDFLLNKYFRWKYTAPNRYATTTNYLKKYCENGRLHVLNQIKDCLFSFDKENIEAGLSIKISGLGVAGRSGLLSLLFPKHFGTVDQFVVKALLNVTRLPERNLLTSMNPNGLTIKDGVILIQIMRQKSTELNNKFKTDSWTPRKIDQILWACRD
ncbi:MAG: hypothetical protein RBU23_00585 [Candidatus Auribacterota bacterium]|jgi:hypothetical protein|nr:hypothetical protein [Candidatus Auribacterota bacterium]